MTLTYGMWRDCLAGLEVTLPENPFVKTIVGEFFVYETPIGSFPLLCYSGH